MDRFQYYEGEEVIRVESDSNLDGKIDTWEYYRDGELERTRIARIDTDF